MLTERVLALLRRKLDETNLVLSDLTDPELLDFVRDAQEHFGNRGVPTMDTLAVDPEPTNSTYGILPEPTTWQGHMLALQAAIFVLKMEYIGKVSRGELAMSWRSGLEEASTISADKAWKAQIADYEDEVEQLNIIKRAPSAGERVQ